MAAFDKLVKSMLYCFSNITFLADALYLYLKSKEAKFDKIKREIVRILSYQIGEDRDLAPFEIQSVINSKLRENRLNLEAIDVDEIIEDLVAETISSPMLDTERKHKILQNLRTIHYKGELLNKIENITINLQGDNNVVQVEEIEDKLKEIIKSRKTVEGKVEELSKKNKEQVRISSLFAVIIGLIGVIFSIAEISGFDRLSSIFENVNLGKEKISVIISFLVTVMAALLSFSLKYFITNVFDRPKKKEEKKKAENKG